jgi:hypothetical protein
LYGNWAGNPNSSQFVDGLLVLISAFGNGDDAFQQATLRFIGSYINKTVSPPRTILSVICDNVRSFNYDGIHTFLKELFGLPHVRWIPMPGVTGQFNPVYRLFWVGKLSKDQRISLTRIMVDHCLHMAEKEQDWRFLLPILDSLKMIFCLRKSFPGVIPKIFRKMASVSVNGFSQAIAAQPLGFQWPSEEHGTRIIDRSNKPNLQLRRRYIRFLLLLFSPFSLFTPPLSPLDTSLLTLRWTHRACHMVAVIFLVQVVV